MVFRETKHDNSACASPEQGAIVISITVEMLDGTKREFPHQTRAGGSYSNKLMFEVGFVVIEDPWGSRTCIPERLVKEVRTTSNRY